MSDLTARLLAPETFEEALKELEALSVTCNGETKRAHLTLATSARIICELHTRLRTAKAEGAAEAYEAEAETHDKLCAVAMNIQDRSEHKRLAIEARDRAAAIRKGLEEKEAK